MQELEVFGSVRHLPLFHSLAMRINAMVTLLATELQRPMISHLTSLKTLCTTGWPHVFKILLPIHAESQRQWRSPALEM